MKEIRYDCDGTTLTGWLADGSGGATVPGILVAHEARGLGPHMKQRISMLAELGYVAFAIDLYGEAGLSLEEALDRHDAMMATPDLMFSRGLAGVRTLASQANVDPTRLAAIGFCQGGITVMELARGDAPIRCAVGFHPNMSRPLGSPDNSINARILMMVGDADPLVPDSSRAQFVQEMRDAGATWELHVFGKVGHSFTNPEVDELEIPGFGFDARADQRAWELMVNFLRDEFDAAGS